MKTYTFPMKIRKPGAESWRMKMRNAIYGLQPLAARLPELAKS